MDKINIVSSHAARSYELSFSTDTLEVFLATGHSLVKHRLFKTAPDVDEPLCRCFNLSTKDLSLTDAMLHDSPVHRTDLGCLEATAWTQ